MVIGSETMKYRSAKITDVEAIKELLNSSNLPLSDIAEHIQYFVVAVEKKEQIFGVGGFEPIGGIGLLRSIAVDPEKRKKGVAKEIYSKIEGMAYKAGVRRFYLITESAVSYFSRLGFVPLSRQNVPPEIRSTKQFSEICPESAAVMYKNIQKINGH